MLPFPHFVLFVPFAVLVFAFVISLAVNGIAGLTPRTRASKPATLVAPPAPPAPAAPAAQRPGAQIIYFRPRKTSLPSGLSFGAR